MKKLLYWLYEEPFFYIRDLKLFRRVMGGTWILFYPTMFPYMRIWDREVDYFDAPHHVIIKTETYRRKSL